MGTGYDLCSAVVCNLCFIFFSPMQGPVYTMDMSEEGFVTGGKDGMAKLWDPDFKNITTVNLASAPGGYKGKSDDA